MLMGVGLGALSWTPGGWGRNWWQTLFLHDRPDMRAAKAHLLENRGLMVEPNLFQKRADTLIASRDGDENPPNSRIAGSILHHGAN